MQVMQERFQNVQSQSQEREDEHRAVLQQVAALETENAKLKKSAAAKPAPAHSQSWRESTTAKSELSTSMPSSRPQTAGEFPSVQECVSIPSAVHLRFS
jgi:plasmid stability protein